MSCGAEAHEHDIFEVHVRRPYHAFKQSRHHCARNNIAGTADIPARVLRILVPASAAVGILLLKKGYNSEGQCKAMAVRKIKVLKQFQ